METETISMSDFKLASYLVASGCNVIATSREAGRVHFVFRASDKLRTVIHDYRFGNPEIPVKTFILAQAQLRSLIFDDPMQ